MTPEPLKGKVRKSIPCPYINAHEVKSAVEGCFKETLKEVESYEREKIKSIFKKWFEDVI